MAKITKQHLKTWIEISKKAVQRNIDIFRDFVGKKTQIWAVVKSNAYGHGLAVFSKIADKAGVDGFCVDSVLEGIKLRQSGIKKMILVMGPTLPALFRKAHENEITITISNKDALQDYLKSAEKPDFHLKIDSGMHRQGFYPKDIPKIIALLKKVKSNFKGVYAHFCAAKDVNYPTYTEIQFDNFQKALKILKKAGFNNLIKHSASTGGALINKKYHLDAVRIGIGLYGLWPAKELNIHFSETKLEPVFSWRVLLSEVKQVKRGDYIGYDLTERAVEDGKIAVLPIGYWHGFPRAFSSTGKVLIGGKFAKVLGRVSMDLIVVDVSGIDCRVGDEAVIIGRQGKNEIAAHDAASRISTTHYELITRVNPLIERILVQ